MLLIKAVLPPKVHFQEFKPKGKRYRWVDKSSPLLQIVAEDSDPWGKEQLILIRLGQGKTRADVTYPKELQLVCFPVSETANPTPAKILRERWKGHFAHSARQTLLFFSFPTEKKSEADHNWLLLSILPENQLEISDPPKFQ